MRRGETSSEVRAHLRLLFGDDLELGQLGCTEAGRQCDVGSIAAACDQYPTDPNNYLAVLPGPVDRNINTEQTFGGRIALEAKPTDDFSATLAAYYQHMPAAAWWSAQGQPGAS